MALLKGVSLGVGFKASKAHPFPVAYPSCSLSPYCFCVKMSAVPAAKLFFLTSWAHKANHMLSFRSCVDQGVLS